MQQREIVSGYSELKDLLIRTYQIERRREFIKLYFTEKNNRLLMHDYNDHKKFIELVEEIDTKIVSTKLTNSARRISQ